jgi:hypothetical protein
MKRPKIASLVRLKQGDTSTLYLVTGHDRTNDFYMFVRAVDELDSKAHLVDISMFREETVGDETHKKIIAQWLLTKDGATLARALTR